MGIRTQNSAAVPKISEAIAKWRNGYLFSAAASSNSRGQGALQRNIPSVIASATLEGSAGVALPTTIGSDQVSSVTTAESFATRTPQLSAAPW